MVDKGPAGSWAQQGDARGGLMWLSFLGAEFADTATLKNLASQKVSEAMGYSTNGETLPPKVRLPGCTSTG